MSCSRGKAHPNSQTKLKLFTDSGGFCQNPSCNARLFFNDEKMLHLAEMAHIFAAEDDGPRAKKDLTKEERGNYNNIILLCPTCHTKIDKDPETYTDQVVRIWKLGHAEKLNAAFGVKVFPSRKELRNEIQKLLLENAAIHAKIGPDNEYKFNPEAAEAGAWKARVLHTIIPNSNLIIRLMDHNIELLKEEEIITLSLFKMHVRGLILRHIIGEPAINIRFPAEMNKVGV